MPARWSPCRLPIIAEPAPAGRPKVVGWQTELESRSGCIRLCPSQGVSRIEPVGQGVSVYSSISKQLSADVSLPLASVARTWNLNAVPKAMNAAGTSRTVTPGGSSTS